MEFKNLLLHLFVLTGCKPPLADVIERPRLVGFVVAKLCLLSTRTWSMLVHRFRYTWAESTDRGAPAVCTSPAEREWRMSKAVDRWPHPHAAADTTGTCSRYKGGIEKISITIVPNYPHCCHFYYQIDIITSLTGTQFGICLYLFTGLPV